MGKILINPGSTVVSGTRTQKLVNFRLGHFACLSPDTIPSFGTTDSYSTQIVCFVSFSRLFLDTDHEFQGELAHRLVKRFYARTNKRNHGPQIAAHERRQRILRKVRRHMLESDAAAAAAEPAEETSADPSTSANMTRSDLQPASESLPRTPPHHHHQISESRRTWIHATQFVSSQPNDPAVENFIPSLKAHLLNRLLNNPYDGDETKFSPQDLANVTIEREHLYSHQTMRINYTTYDLGHDQDTINPRTRSDIMVLSHENEDDQNWHPYWYARVLGIFHADVRHVGPKAKSHKPVRMEFLWVRWFGRDLSFKAGWKAKCLHRLGFEEPEHAFGFLDPAEVIRGAHLIPAFHYGCTTTLLAPSIARQPQENDTDFHYYYINL
ncbi:hypothetical protein DFH07DRAFT_744109 [Mycena maculata]|uniref:Uncharacterized protein n=1 Tax=Mycena maculata TaxID=230809 RepID=A0AAD7J2U7_9AGAR|nr:hypothetical protein DFH07DRAFT_744109 [Mycena maculata]